MTTPGEHWVTLDKRGSPPYRVLDAAVGIGTQALGLAAQGFRVTGSDISLAAVKRAGEEAGRRGLRLVTPCSETSHTPRRRHRPSALRVHCRSSGRWQLKWALITAAVD
jgi:methylase of polypeptide subunit release factors